MALLAYNKTTSPLTLAAGNPAPVLPASTMAGIKGAAVNVTAELSGLSISDYALLQAQVAALQVEFEWSDLPEYSTDALIVGTTPQVSTTLRSVMQMNSSGVAARYFVAVRPGGNDATGVVGGPAYDNSGRAAAIAHPFATIQAAYAAGFNSLNNQAQLFIDLTGMVGANKILINSAATIMRMFPGNDNVGGNNQPSAGNLLNPLFGNPGTPGQNIPTEGQVNFFADPTTLDTLATLDITSTTVDAVTGQKTLVTTKNYTAGQYEGKIIYGSGTGERAIIASCSAGPNSQLELTTSGTLTAPLTIADYGCEIQNQNVPAFFFLEGRQSTKFSGINFNPATNSPALNGFITGYIGGTACRFGGAIQAFRTFFLEPECCFFDGSVFSGINFVMVGVGPRLNNSYFKYINWNNRGFAFPAQLALLILDNCTPFGHGNPSPANATQVNALIAANQSGGTFYLQRTKIRNARAFSGFPGYGIYYGAGESCQIETTTINNCASDAVNVDGGRLVLINVTGTGNGGVGINALDGAQVQIDANVTVTGTGGDIKAGNMAARTWSDFRGSAPVKNQFDVPGFTGATADTATGARIWQP